MDIDKETNQPDADVSKEERELLDQPFSGESADDARGRTLDNTDEDGTVLNEEVDNSGKDLDIPGEEDDDTMEDIGEEDEENNGYSEADTE